MKNPIHTTLLALGLAIAGGAHASDATEFALPGGSTLTRAEVMAETRKAQAAGELQIDESDFRVAVPQMSRLSREQVRMRTVEAMESRAFGDRAVAGGYFIGGM
jgi:hypothetical protein